MWLQVALRSVLMAVLVSESGCLVYISNACGVGQPFIKPLSLIKFVGRRLT